MHPCAQGSVHTCMPYMHMQYMHISILYTYIYTYAHTDWFLLWDGLRLFLTCDSSFLEWQSHYPTSVSCLKSPSVLISPQIIGQLSHSLQPCYSCLRVGKASRCKALEKWVPWSTRLAWWSDCHPVVRPARPRPGLTSASALGAWGKFPCGSST